MSNFEKIFPNVDDLFEDLEKDLYELKWEGQREGYLAALKWAIRMPVAGIRQEIEALDAEIKELDK